MKKLAIYRFCMRSAITFRYCSFIWPAGIC